MGAHGRSPSRFEAAFEVDCCGLVELPRSILAGVYRIKVRFIVTGSGVRVVLVGPGIKAIDVGRRIGRIVASIFQASSMVEHVANYSRDTLVLPTFFNEAVAARIDRNTLGWNIHSRVEGMEMGQVKPTV